MKRLLAALALAVGVVWACTVPELPEVLACEVQADCIEGFVCVDKKCERAEGAPDGGSSDAGDSGIQDAGHQEPTVLAVELLPGGDVVDGGTAFVYADPREPGARHRDEAVVVRVRSDLLNLEAGTLSVSMRGQGVGSDASPVGVEDCGAASFCKDVRLQLWDAPLDAFRGTFTVNASIRDATSGITHTAKTSFKVTRWKWAFTGEAGPIQTSPAIGPGGTVFFGTGTPTGSVFALNPGGTVRWSKRVGEVTTGPVVGTAGGGRVYVGVDATSVTSGDGRILYALSSSSGAQVGAGCSLVANEFRTPLALTTTQRSDEPAKLETVVTLREEYPSAEATLVAFRPDAEASRRCDPLPLETYSIPDAGSMIAVGSDVYFASDPGLYGLRYSSSGWIPKPGFTVIDAPWGETTGLALAKNTPHLVMAGARDDTSLGGALGSFHAADGGAGPNYAWGSGVPPIRNLVLGFVNGAETAFFGHDWASGELKAVSTEDMTLKVTAQNAGRLPNAPVLGASGKLYTATSGAGRVTEWNVSGLTPVWAEDSIAAVADWPASGSPALDCARYPDGGTRTEQLGTLYVPGGNGVLHAIIVDSRGLDTSAAWPHFQHDARNTGNPATSLACP
ncbi:PQQ-like beta-propeller repeat protein [Pyxidicoccus parkwayensis]|uniref:PQQ-like beta-propeller repeat protein n=1 Tax=Pyxidicoccus parkwayensis TaxID=2813578 RepID=A0ABX7NTN5_9BACT|nr:PQQ-binding-like beta-propeller repeat protein [Pyxidicoccus parkwaysis]QSQ19508.1 PQQ-like beta-propeller repeat protein [Pyxidicoccus parkwaysis]